MSSRGILIAVLSCVAVAELHAQMRESAAALPRPLFVNDEWERYARVRQIVGDSPLYPWTVRTFTARESRLLAETSSDHPWANIPTSPTRSPMTGVRIAPVDADVRVVMNSAFPFGFNDGEVWSGRGITSIVSGGAQAHVGPIAATVVPLAFRAENSRFTLRPTGGTGLQVYADAFAPLSMDQPQRFGDAPYQRLSLANSTLELDVPWLAAGFSTAAQHWGPARDHPLILGNNAGGFPHAFLGTASPVNVFIGRVHTRMMWGKLDASEYFHMRDSARYRFAPGIALSFLPAGVPGLELGFARFFHLKWEPGVINRANILRPFIGIVRNQRSTPTDPMGNEPDNQIASIFGRWVLPASGFELYGEFAKEDYNGEFRDLFMQPDHISGFLFGFQRAVEHHERYRVFRAELLNTRISPLALNRPQSPFYIHSPVTQGHTHRGQVLGSVAAFGGGAFVLGFDDYNPGGRRSLSFSRMMRAEFRSADGATPVPGEADIFYTLSVDGIRFRGPVGITYELSSVYEASRYYEKDAINIRVSTGMRYTW